MKKVISIILLASALNIQAQNLDSIHAAMSKLHPMVGDWSGTGWIRQGNQTSQFKQTEKISYELDKSTLLINGKGYDNGELVFEAMAIVSYNTTANKYRFNSFLSDGKYTEAEGWFDAENNFNWQFEVPNGGNVRYSIQITSTTWSEKGAYSPPNTTSWYPFMEMNLTKNNKDER